MDWASAKAGIPVRMLLLIPVREDEFALQGSSEYDDTWSASGYVFQVESSGFADRLDVYCVRGKS